MNIEKKYKDLISKAKEYMSSINDCEHNWNHIMDVVENVKKLLEIINFKVNKDVCIISAYWHDVGRTKLGAGHEKLSAEMLKSYMLEYNYPLDLIELCYLAIENHKWNMTPKTIEGLLLKDADKLAFLGSGRWMSCLDKKQSLDDIINLLPILKNDILYFEESRIIYDKKIINILKLLYEKIYAPPVIEPPKSE